MLKNQPFDNNDNSRQTTCHKLNNNSNNFIPSQETRPNTDTSKFNTQNEMINNVFDLSKTKQSKTLKNNSVETIQLDTPLQLGSQDLIDIFIDENEFQFESEENKERFINDFYKIIEVIAISNKEKILKCDYYTGKSEDNKDDANTSNKVKSHSIVTNFNNNDFIYDRDTNNTSYVNLVKIKLKGLWAEVIADPGDIVYICAEYNNLEQSYLITDVYHNTNTNDSNINSNSRYQNFNTQHSFEILKNFLIIEPETLISPSRIKTAFPCYRKSILGEQFKLIRADNTNKELIVGSIIHEVFQTVIKNCANNDLKISKSYVEEVMHKIIQNFYLDIALDNLDLTEIHTIVKSYITNIIKFFENFFLKRLNIQGIKVKNYNASEKVIQSQVLGMKGIIDMLVETNCDESKEIEMTPVELKTGNSQNNQDLIQILVYCLILSEQLEKNSYNGILVYLKKDSQIRIKLKQNDIINVFVVRNNIAKIIKKMSSDANFYHEGLDGLYKNKSECARCFQKDVCYFHYVNYEKRKELENIFKNFKNADDNNDNSSKIEPEKKLDTDNGLEIRKFLKTENLFEEDLKTLEKYFIDSDTYTYFSYFHSIINEEESYNYINDKIKIRDGEIADLSEFKNYKIENVIDKENSYDIIVYNSEDDIIIKDTHSNSNTHKRDNHANNLEEIQSQFAYINDGFHIYESIHKKSFLGILINKHDDNSSKFTLNILKNYVYKTKLKTRISFWNDVRINRIYLKNINKYSKYSYKLMRGNLYTICRNINPKLKDLIIHHKKPTFNFDLKSEIMNFISKNFDKEFKYMNLNQKTAILKVFLSEDYTCIIGFPGSGKTTLISLLVCILYKMKKKILIVAHTNLAVDNILIKLKERGVDFVRITNNENSVAIDIRDKILKTNKFREFSQWKDYLNGLYVYGVTTLGVCNKLVLSNSYDYCIVDEACQIFEPNLLGPLLLSKKFVLVGDPFQLPALIKSNTAPPSLFERLIDKHPEISVQLNNQYRMNNEILRLSNECVYQNIIKCANNEVASQRLELNIDLIENYQVIRNNNWLSNVLDPNRPVVFVDYADYINKHKKDFFNSYMESNPIECEIVVKIIEALKYAAYDLNSVGIITPYKAQENLIFSSLIEFDFYNVYTIDKSQGLEKDVIIISFVKNNVRTKLLKDIARINVAFTRPKSKLIIIGLIDCLIEIDKLRNYIDVIKREKWCYNIYEI